MGIMVAGALGWQPHHHLWADYLEQWFQPGVCEDILHINEKETQEPLEPWTSSDPRTHEDSSPNWGAGMPETSSDISLTGQNHINNW
jgi:hypothetical protein